MRVEDDDEYNLCCDGNYYECDNIDYCPKAKQCKFENRE